MLSRSIHQTRVATSRCSIKVTNSWSAIYLAHSALWYCTIVIDVHRFFKERLIKMPGIASATGLISARIRPIRRPKPKVKENKVTMKLGATRVTLCISLSLFVYILRRTWNYRVVPERRRLSSDRSPAFLILILMVVRYYAIIRRIARQRRWFDALRIHG